MIVTITLLLLPFNHKDTIMNKEDISYADYLEAVHAIMAEGLNPGVRTVRARIGGSHSTIVEYRRRWLSESETAKQIDESVSPALSDAIKAEFGRIAQIIRAESAARISKSENEVKETSDLLKESERNLARSEAQHKATASQLLELEKKLAALEARLSDGKEEVARLLSETTDALARSQAQAEQSSITLKVAEQKISEQNAEIESQRQARHDAEVRAAVAESKLEEQKNKK
jgi:chromosome segregation ATPase